MLTDFEGRVAVVTGAAGGIGLGLAERFGAEGMKVVLADIDPELPSVERRLRESGVEALAVHTDVSDASQVDALAARTIDAFGQVDLVCNNAGVGGALAFENMTLEDWEFELGVDLWGVIHGLRSYLPLLREREEAHVVNTASMAGLLHAPFLAGYNAAKAAVVALTETLYQELALSGSSVGISVLCPGAVVTRAPDEPNVPELLKRSTRPGLDEVHAQVRRQLLEHGQAPAEVAERVVEAIRNDELYVLTHPEFVPVVQQRFDAIVAGENQPLAGLGEMTRAKQG
ncbi:MAG: short-chain dehydrogenase/reductase [Solirubrobacterales bacterium]|nr:short-chain dehydrogenase/reductase [Solirubrobacterales bacterium]